MTFTDSQLPAVRVLANRPRGFDLWNEYLREKHGMKAGAMLRRVQSSPKVVPDGYAKVKFGFNAIPGERRDKSADGTIFLKLSDLIEFEDQWASILPVVEKEGKQQ